MQQSDFDLLQTVPPYHLQSLIKTRHIAAPKLQLNSSSSIAPPQSMAEVAQTLFDQDSISEAFEELNDLEKLLLRELCSCGGRANSRDLALYFTSAGLLTPVKKNEQVAHESPVSRVAELSLTYQPGGGLQYPAAHPHGVFEQALRHLLVLGLLFWGKQTNFMGREYTSGVHDGVLIVPLTVQESARSSWGLSESLRQFEDEENSTSQGEGIRALQRLLYLYWSLVSATRDGLAIINNGLLARSALRHVVEKLGPKLHIEQARVESDAPHLLFIRLLLMKLGLLQERHGVIYALPAESFFSLPLLERARRCFHLYLETPFWNELFDLPEVNVRPGPTLLEPAHEEVIRARHAVVERLLYEGLEQWHDFATFIARTKLYVPYLLFPRQYGPRAERYSSGSNPYGWDFRLRRGWLTHREGWHLVEGGFIRSVVGGPLHWLGLVETDREEAPNSFRLLPDIITSLSNTSSADEDEGGGRLIVQPNFELVALAPVPELLLVKLDRFAELVSLEHIAQYKLTKSSVTRAIQMGLHAENIQAMLEQAAGKALPQNVSYSLAEWERQARRVEIWNSTTLLEVDDEAWLDELLASEQTRHLFRRRLAPRIAEVTSQQLAALQELLWQRDYLPALTQAPAYEGPIESWRASPHEPQWQLHDSGLLQPLYAVLDLYLVAELEGFSARDEASGWSRLTPSALQKALQQGISLEYIVRFLQQYCEGGIPGSLLIRLKLWGNGYEAGHDIHVEHAPLLRLPSQVLQDLQADQEIQSLLGQEVEPAASLVRVDQANLARVLALLRERGFSLD
ncbi:helicase-associated domain-containing protein [Ktedonosporobacter rubrisoli]|nr:helicase-associated domain-containing protein [Ktedonosporobacter rubrisoli]